MAENEKAQKVTLRPVPWFEGAREMIARAEPGGDSVLDWIERQIKANAITLFEVRDEWELIGILTARWVRNYNGERHLAFLHSVSFRSEDGFSLILMLEDAVKKIARDCGCSRIEIHSQRRGLSRIVERHGYEFQESIFSIGV
ncbi:MAG: hypothetical protein WCH86_02335 [Kiritimatiellales bacterium]